MHEVLDYVLGIILFLIILLVSIGWTRRRGGYDTSFDREAINDYEIVSSEDDIDEP
ncbi:MAG: hypothetical protein GXY16_07295 [Syntrophomonadaceae bacterium]|nr:hypothetical protein [Syntrophomonadaceae bacterium]